MSKLYMMNRMRYSPAAGDFFSSILKIGKGIVKGIGSAFSSGKAKEVMVQTVLPAAKKAAPYVAPALAGYAVGELTGGGSSSGASGGWGYRRRRRGITATELRGYRKVANLIHKEGMVSKRARGRH